MNMKIMKSVDLRCFFAKKTLRAGDVGRDQCTVFQSFERSILIRSDLSTRPAASIKKPGGFCEVGVRLAMDSRRAQRAKPAEFVCWPASVFGLQTVSG